MLCRVCGLKVIGDCKVVASVVKVLEAEMVQTCAEGESGGTQDSICICRLDLKYRCSHYCCLCILKPQH